MTRTCAVGLMAALVGGSVGCQGLCDRFDTPRSLRGTPSPDSKSYDKNDDNSTEAQERRGRARWALTEDDFRIGPRTFADRPDPVSGGIGGGVSGPR